MITFLRRRRFQCQTKEDCEAAYNSQYGPEKDYDSIGDNLENFIEDLKNNKYGFQNAGLDSIKDTVRVLIFW